MSRRTQLFVLLGVLMTLPACPKAITEGAIAGMTSDKSLAAYDALMSDKQLQDDVANLIQQTSGAAFDAMSAPARQAQLRAAVAAMVDTLADRIDVALKTKLGPDARAEIAATITDALSADRRNDASDFAAQVTRATVDAFTRTATRDLAQGLEHDVGPAMSRTLQTDLGPAIRKVIEDDLSSAFAKTMKDNTDPAAKFVGALSKSAADGLGASLAADGVLGAALDHRDEALRNDLAQARQLVYGFGGVAAILALVIGYLLRQVRALSEGKRDREDLVVRLAGAVHDVQDSDEGRYVAARMRQVDGTRAGEVFKSLITAHGVAFKPGPGAPAGFHAAVLEKRRASRSTG